MSLSRDVTGGHMEMLADQIRPLLKVAETELNKHAVKPKEDTPGSLLLEVTTNFLLGEAGGRSRVIGLLEEMIESVRHGTVIERRY